MGFFDSIYSDNTLPHRAKAVYMYLQNMAVSTGQCWPGIRTIAADLGLSKSTVKRALADLEKHGYVSVKRNRKGARGMRAPRSGRLLS